MRPSSPETSAPACTKRNTLSISSSTSCCSTSRKCSPMVRADLPTRKRTPGALSLPSQEHGGLVPAPGLTLFPVRLLRLRGALADAADQAVPLVVLGGVVNALVDEHRLAHAGPTEQAGLAPPLDGGQQIDGLDAGFQHLPLRGALGKGRGRAMNGAALALDGRAVIDGDRKSTRLNSSHVAISYA